MNFDIKTDFVDSKKGQRAFIACHGPSFNEYSERILELKNKKFTVFGCNEWNEFYKEPPDFLVFASSVNTIQNHKDILNKHPNLTVVYADSVDMTDKKWIEDHINCNYAAYDQKHFDCKKCQENSIIYGTDDGLLAGECCNRIIPGRETIQELLMHYSGHDKHYFTGDTVATHMISLAILMGFSEIYLSGIHLSYTAGYAKTDPNCVSIHNINPDELDRYTPRIIKDLTIIQESAILKGCKIINTNLDATYGIFPKEKLIL
jgi:hypothetical protein